MYLVQFITYSVSFGNYLFLHFACISIPQVRRFTTMKNILKLLLLFNPGQANTSFLSPLFSWSVERKYRLKIDQYIQEAIIKSYGLFVEFEINLILILQGRQVLARHLSFVDD